MRIEEWMECRLGGEAEWEGNEGGAKWGLLTDSCMRRVGYGAKLIVVDYLSIEEERFV